MPELLVRREGPIGTLVISNVSRHNAMTYAMWHEYPQRLRELDADEDVRVIVLCGDGENAFVSGADISQFERTREEEGMQDAYNRALETAYSAPSHCGKPVIAKIRGFCMGGGLGIAAGCDVRGRIRAEQLTCSVESATTFQSPFACPRARMRMLQPVHLYAAHNFPDCSGSFTACRC